MKFPHYIYYEILIRVNEFMPNVGDFLSVVEREDDCIINTTTGKLTLNHHLLSKQFKDPSLIRPEDILALKEYFFVLG